MEASSIERRLLRSVFEKGILSYDDYSKFGASIATQETHLNLFKKILDENELKSFEKQLKNCQDCFEVERFRKILIDKAKKMRLYQR